MRLRQLLYLKFPKLIFSSLLLYMAYPLDLLGAEASNNKCRLNIEHKSLSSADVQQLNNLNYSLTLDKDKSDFTLVKRRAKLLSLEKKIRLYFVSQDPVTSKSSHYYEFPNDMSKLPDCSTLTTWVKNFKQEREGTRLTNQYTTVNGSLGEFIISRESSLSLRVGREFDLQYVLERYRELLKRGEYLKDNFENIDPSESLSSYVDQVNQIRNLLKLVNIESHVADNTFLSDYFLNGGGNCVSRTMILSALIYDLKLKAPKDYSYSVQLFADHVAPVLYRDETQEVVDLMQLTKNKVEDGTLIIESSRFINQSLKIVPQLLLKNEKERNNISANNNSQAITWSSNKEVGEQKRLDIIDYSVFGKPTHCFALNCAEPPDSSSLRLSFDINNPPRTRGGSYTNNKRNNTCSNFEIVCDSRFEVPTFLNGYKSIVGSVLALSCTDHDYSLLTDLQKKCKLKNDIRKEQIRKHFAETLPAMLKIMNASDFVQHYRSHPDIWKKVRNNKESFGLSRVEVVQLIQKYNFDVAAYYRGLERSSRISETELLKLILDASTLTPKEQEELLESLLGIHMQYEIIYSKDNLIEAYKTSPLSFKSNPVLGVTNEFGNTDALPRKLAKYFVFNQTFDFVAEVPSQDVNSPQEILAQLGISNQSSKLPQVNLPKIQLSTNPCKGQPQGTIVHFGGGGNGMAVECKNEEGVPKLFAPGKKISVGSMWLPLMLRLARPVAPPHNGLHLPEHLKNDNEYLAQLYLKQYQELVDRGYHLWRPVNADYDLDAEKQFYKKYGLTEEDEIYLSFGYESMPNGILKYLEDSIRAYQSNMGYKLNF